MGCLGGKVGDLRRGRERRLYGNMAQAGLSLISFVRDMLCPARDMSHTSPECLVSIMFQHAVAATEKRLPLHSAG